MVYSIVLIDVGSLKRLRHDVNMYIHIDVSSAVPSWCLIRNEFVSFCR